ncbi:zinc finger FYVE domain-containing protein 9 isoform X2 [Episyrphus balteatus]|uniref:zinc finger FYVE domain-containing protein 9 isoform X2 n=1 Tax=Episyrphus balteatus TaxID=286459 RepID=UPI002484E859|nr:zinc finger FYVE domain-containing protein 9 isoform X2 [Episyrphus balteatus]
MDLVDIDKVLDNLELNEEEHQKERQNLTSDIVSSQSQISSSVNEPEHSLNYGVTTTLNNTTTTTTTSTGDRVSKFVGVSQVFSSLDDYRKNVESLDLYTNNKNDGNTNTNTNYNNLKNNDHTLLMRNDGVNDDDEDDEDEEVSKDDEDEDEDDPYAGDEINKFVSTDEYGFSSNSITTSSSSTFSSGPSPALISTESESSLNAKEELEVRSEAVKQIDTNSQQIKNDSTTSDGIESIQPNENDCSSGNSNSTSKIRAQHQQRSEFDDLAVGLSSISLTTHQESILSLSEIASASSKFNLKTDNLSSSLSLSQTTKNNYPNSNEKPEQLNEQKIDSGDTGEHPQLENSISGEEDLIRVAATTQPNVMVTFSSTMDEISDTELDSILQEIDTEMHSQQIVSPEQDSASGSNIGDVINKTTTTQTSKSNNPNEDDLKLTTTSILPNNLSLIGQKCGGGDDGMMNIDSFSQASTLEFTEDRRDVDDLDKAINLDEISDDGDQSKEEEKKGIQKRQRPTTLDLPVRKINLYATAGQTPPGSRIYDQGTSSSEEETPDEKVNEIKSDEELNFNDGAGHTPPERSDREVGFDNNGVVGGGDACSSSDIETANVGDEPMIASESTEVEVKIPPSKIPEILTAPESATASACAPAPELTNIPIAVSNDMSVNNNYNNNNNIGKVPPIWVPDQEANACMQCQHKFTLLKRRHHCRACGQVLCSVCCSQKFKLEFLSNLESRVCVQCFLILTKLTQQQKQQIDDQQMNCSNTTTTPLNPQQTTSSPNPNNPMEYCSKIPPYRQVNQQAISSYPTVIVPVGVLKKEGSAAKSRKRKSVMFSDGIRPGSDLASLDGRWSDAKHARKSNSANNLNTSDNLSDESNKIISRNNSKSIVLMDDGKGCYIPPTGEHTLPPIVISKKSEKLYQEVTNNADLIKRLQTESLKFVIQTNFFVFVKISHLKCCINKTVINFTTCGLNNVGNDEIIILLELDNSNKIPKDIFVHLNEIYWEASRGHPITELGFSMPKHLHFLGSREHGGFLFIRSTFQCLLDVHVPSPPFLIGVLIHRWEVPWAKIFPLRLMLRLGAQYRYYPSPHISVREREPVYAEIAQTIINLLADFRNYTYTIPTIKGMYIHMEDRRTNILIPRNRLDEVVKAINNSSDHILAMGANFSKNADGHLVCIQNIKLQNGDSHAYSTQAINIQGQPRKVTGASFFVFNEALKTTSGLSGKCSIIEDGLMVQILPSKMAEIRHSLLNMKDINIVCGPIDADEQQTEVVYVQWVDNDVEINIGYRMKKG